MRETRLYGSEGGVARKRHPYPYRFMVPGQFGKEQVASHEPPLYRRLPNNCHATFFFSTISQPSSSASRRSRLIRCSCAFHSYTARSSGRKSSWYLSMW